MQSVGELYNNNAHVLRHCDENPTEVFRLRLFFGLIDDFFELGNARYEAQHLVAELTLDILFRGLGILDNVVQKRRRDNRRIQAHFH